MSTSILEDDTKPTVDDDTLAAIISLKLKQEREDPGDIVRQRINMALKPIREQIEIALSRIGSFSANLSNREADIRILLEAHMNNEFPGNLLVGNSKLSIYSLAFFHLNTLNNLSAIELFEKINQWKNLFRLAGKKDQLMNTYMIILDKLPESIDDILFLRILVMIRYIFPVEFNLTDSEETPELNNKPLNHIYFQVFVKDDVEKARKLFERTKLSEISFITDDSDLFIESCLKSIVGEVEA